MQLFKNRPAERQFLRYGRDENGRDEDNAEGRNIRGERELDQRLLRVFRSAELCDLRHDACDDHDHDEQERRELEDALEFVLCQLAESEIQSYIAEGTRRKESGNRDGKEHPDVQRQHGEQHVNRARQLLRDKMGESEKARQESRCNHEHCRKQKLSVGKTARGIDVVFQIQIPRFSEI